jgi:hypothetical protein
MLRKSLFILISLFSSALLQAQTVKTGVLVIGEGSSALAAALQSAISNAPTTLILEGQELNLTPIGENISSGLEAEFLKRMRKAKGIKDSTARVSLDRGTVNAVVKEWLDSTKKLTVIRGAKFYRFKRAGSGWNVQLSTGQTFKAKVLVNAGKVIPPTGEIQVPSIGAAQWKGMDYADKIYRVSVASGYHSGGSNANILPLYALLLPDQDNFVGLNPAEESMAGGQAAGATAAYAAFFDTKTSLSNLKSIQGELITYKLAIVPFADVAYTDSNWKAIQFVGSTGVLQAKIDQGKALFLPNQEVSTGEVKDLLKEFFYKAQIWFEDYKQEKMTVGSTLKLVSEIGNKSYPNTLASVQKNWNKSYNFKGAFDLNKVITRREFAVLLHDYLPPFNVITDKTGRVTR